MSHSPAFDWEFIWSRAVPAGQAKSRRAEQKWLLGHKAHNLHCSALGNSLAITSEAKSFRADHLGPSGEERTHDDVMKHDKWLSELTKLQRLALPSFLVLTRLLYLTWSFLPSPSIRTSACRAQEEGTCTFFGNLIVRFSCLCTH